MLLKSFSFFKALHILSNDGSTKRRHQALYLLKHRETKKRQNPVSEHLDMKIHFGDVLSQDESKSKSQHYKALDDLDFIAKTNILVIYSSVSPTIHAQCPQLWKQHGTHDASHKL